MIESRSERREIHLRYAGIFKKCQDIAVIFSSSQLGELFEHAGTAFLEFAERSEDNRMQGRFFEAMGLIQRRRAAMERIFRREIDQGFERFGQRDAAVSGIDSSDKSDEEIELSLVDQEEMEESVVAENLVSKANESYFPELYALSQRLAVINDGEKLKDNEIPVSPRHLVQAFRRSLDGFEVEVEVKIKLVLYALFDKFVVKQAKGLYDEINDVLKDAGILPTLKPAYVKPRRSSGNPKSTAAKKRQGQEDAQADAGEGAGTVSDEQEVSSLGAELIDSIIDLMAKRRGNRRVVGRRGPAPASPAEREAERAATRDLVAAVGKVQSGTTPGFVHATQAEAAAIPDLEIDAAFVEKVKETLDRERGQILAQVDQNKLPEMDADMIDLIGMLFEYMLNDLVLPNLAKALLSHLHTPYLKVALIDRKLLVHPKHPARRLLDQMVEAGSLWVDEKNPQQGIFPALQGIVDRVLKEFSDNVALFDELSASFEQTMKEQRRKTDAIEQRTQNTALGREKLRLAKRRAGHQIQTLLRRTTLPAPVTGFLSKTWLDRLIFILLRDKDEDRGNAWRQAVKIAEDLVTLFEPKAGIPSKGAGAEGIADLRARITEGIRSMGSYPYSTSGALFKLLDAPETWQKSCTEAAAAQPQEARAQKVPEELPAQESGLAHPTAVSEQEREVIKKLGEMKLGTWFELKSGTDAVPKRIKLSWLSELTATCLFVDRSGMQAEIKTLQELAREILSGDAKVIPRPRHPFIERALVSIRNMLQGGEETTPADEAPQQ